MGRFDCTLFRKYILVFVSIQFQHDLLDEFYGFKTRMIFQFKLFIKI